MLYVMPVPTRCDKVSSASAVLRIIHCLNNNNNIYVPLLNTWSRDRVEESDKLHSNR